MYVGLPTFFFPLCCDCCDMRACRPLGVEVIYDQDLTEASSIGQTMKNQVGACPPLFNPVQSNPAI